MPAIASHPLIRQGARGFVRIFGPFIRHPLTNLVLGFALLGVGLVEAFEDIAVMFDSSIEIYHGFLLFGLATVLHALLELAEGVEVIVAAEDRIEEEEASHAGAAR